MIPLAKAPLLNLLPQTEEDQIKFLSDTVSLKQDEKRVTAILQALWDESTQDEDLVVFLEQGYENFKKCYGHSAPVRSLRLKGGLTLGIYADKNKSTRVANLCNTLEPEPKSFLFKAAILGVISGIGYLAYKKYKSMKGSMILATNVDLGSSKS